MKKGTPKRLDVSVGELEAILDRTREGPLNPEDHQKLKAAVDTLAYLTQELEAKGASIARLRRLLFGPKTETTRRVLGEAVGGGSGGDGGTEAPPADPAAAGEHATRPKRPGHGRNGVAAYRGAERIGVAHDALHHGDACPSCARGKVYRQGEPGTRVRIRGMSPLQASVYELERLRCGACGEVFTAPSPAGVGSAKYDETAAAMVALLKYGTGMPFYRLEKLQASLGIPLPATTAWELVKEAAGSLQPVYAEVIRQAAQGEVLYNDDTTMKILSLEKPTPKEAADAAEPKGSDPERTGTFTSGIVSTAEGRQAAVFFTGRQHAGENLRDLLAQRTRELSPPIQMCDALSRNTPQEFETILAYCLAHARRQFVDVTTSFPQECRYVLESLREVYRHDEMARNQGMSPAERLAFHQQQSGPIMDDLETWLRTQVQEKLVEPNSGLGEAIAYMRKHWARLTLFLHKPGAPLDNTICERALKRAILHRKNAMFYKTENGARVGDLFMSLIHTAELNHIDPFHYLVTLQRRTTDVAAHPGDWMPWNYQDTLATDAPPEPSG
jgi:transposase